MQLEMRNECSHKQPNSTSWRYHEWPRSPRLLSVVPVRRLLPCPRWAWPCSSLPCFRVRLGGQAHHLVVLDLGFYQHDEVCFAPTLVALLGATLAAFLCISLGSEAFLTARRVDTVEFDVIGMQKS